MGSDSIGSQGIPYWCSNESQASSGAAGESDTFLEAQVSVNHLVE